MPKVYANAAVPQPNKVPSDSWYEAVFVAAHINKAPEICRKAINPNMA
jgi:hypothetical protein